MVMKTAYEKELRSLQSWINNVNNTLAHGGIIVIDSASVNNTYDQIEAVANGVESEYPFYATELKNISAILFNIPEYGSFSLNCAAFGELFIIIRHIVQEPIDMAVWHEIHPRIIGTSQGLFCDGYYDSAAEKAVKEVESRLRELFQILKPDVTVPAKVGDLLVRYFQRIEHTIFPICLQLVGGITARVYNPCLRGFFSHIGIHRLTRIFRVPKGKLLSRSCWQVN